jgi:hypothetical protein
METTSSRSRAVPCGRTDGHDGATIAFRNFAHTPKNHLRYTSSLSENHPSIPLPPVPIPSHVTDNCTVSDYRYFILKLQLVPSCSLFLSISQFIVECFWNVMAHAQKPDFVFHRNGRVHLNRQVREFSRLLAAEVCASALVLLDTPCSEVVWRVPATHSNRQFPLHFPSRASPCAIIFQLDFTTILR